MSRKSLDLNPADYCVGFGKPPAHTQFQKGQSGNPQGRPKGRRNVATVLQAALDERVTVTENGQRKSLTKLEATMKQVVNRAASGDCAATKILLQLFPFLDNALKDNTQQAVSAEADQQMLTHMLMRLQGTHVSLSDDAPSNKKEST